MGWMINEYKTLVRIYDKKSLFGRPTSGLYYNIKIDLKEIRCRTMDCVQLAKDKVQC